MCVCIEWTVWVSGRANGALIGGKHSTTTTTKKKEQNVHKKGEDMCFLLARVLQNEKRVEVNTWYIHWDNIEAFFS